MTGTAFGASVPYQERVYLNCQTIPCFATFRRVPHNTRLQIEFASCYLTSSTELWIGVSYIGQSPAFGQTDPKLFRHHLVWRDVTPGHAYWAVSQPVVLSLGARKRPEIQVVQIGGSNHSGECSISGRLIDVP